MGATGHIQLMCVVSTIYKLTKNIAFAGHCEVSKSRALFGAGPLTMIDCHRSEYAGFGYYCCNAFAFAGAPEHSPTLTASALWASLFGLTRCAFSSNALRFARMLFPPVSFSLQASTHRVISFGTTLIPAAYAARAAE